MRDQTEAGESRRFSNTKTEISHRYTLGNHKESSRSGTLGLRGNPRNTILLHVLPRRNIRVIRAIGLLIREKLEGAETNIWNVRDVLAVDTV